MDATTQLNTDVPLYFRFYLPSTGAPYAPTPAPTVTVYRVNEADGTRTALVAALTALTAISGLTGAYVYLLDDSLNTALGQLVGEAVTTDAALTPYPEYATRTYIAQVVTAEAEVDLTPITDVTDKFHFSGSAGQEKVNSHVESIATDAISAAAVSAGAVTKIQNGLATAVGIAAAVWNYLWSLATTPGSFGALVAAQLNMIGAGVVFVQAPVDSDGTTRLTKGVSYTDDYRLHYISDSTRDLLASGVVIKLQWGGGTASFEAGEITGSAGAWDIYVPITGDESAELVYGQSTGELALYENSVERPAIATFPVTVIAAR